MPTATIIACATPCGGSHALVRLSGPRATAIAARAGIVVPEPWLILAQEWKIPAGRLPCRILHAPAGRSATGETLIEITLPGSEAVVELALCALRACGAEDAQPGAFTRQALARGRLRLDQAEALLALTGATDTAAARRALGRLRGELGEAVAYLRDRLLGLRALVEAGLDFLDEADVRAFEPGWMREELKGIRTQLQRWQVATLGAEGPPLIVLVGPANAGKSTLFQALSGAQVLISAQAGTTRDVLEEEIVLQGRRVRLADTAGWMASADPLEARAQAAGRRLLDAATVIVACSAPDAPLPPTHGLPAATTIILGTKADLGRAADPRALATISASRPADLQRLTALLAGRLGQGAASEPRQGRLLMQCDAILGSLVAQLPADELLAEDLRTLTRLLGDLLGETTSDEVLAAIFSRFCIGK